MGIELDKKMNTRIIHTTLFSFALSWWCQLRADEANVPPVTLAEFVEKWNELQRGDSKERVYQKLGAPHLVLGMGGVGEPHWWRPIDAAKNVEFAVWFKEGRLFANQIVICGIGIEQNSVRDVFQSPTERMGD